MSQQHWTIRTHDAGTRLPPHRHPAARMVVVLDGEFVERSAEATQQCGASTVLVRSASETHEDEFRTATRYLSVDLPAALLPRSDFETFLLTWRAPLVLDRIVSQSVRQLRLRTARRLIADRCSAPLRIGAIAREVGLSPAALVRGFHRLYGRTPHETLQEERIRRACRALRGDPRAPLASIALACGFFDQSHLTNTFRRVLGMTPTEYEISSKT